MFKVIPCIIRARLPTPVFTFVCVNSVIGHGMIGCSITCDGENGMLASLTYRTPSLMITKTTLFVSDVYDGSWGRGGLFYLMSDAVIRP